MKIDKPTDTPVEQFGHGVTREWFYDKQIVAFTRPSISRGAIDSWFNAVYQTYQEWPIDRPFLGLHDFSGGYSQTPYSRARTRELAAVPKKGFEVYSAAVLPRSHARTLVVLLFHSIEQFKLTQFRQWIFFDYSDAFAKLVAIKDSKAGNE